MVRHHYVIEAALERAWCAVSDLVVPDVSNLKNRLSSLSDFVLVKVHRTLTR